MALYQGSIRSRVLAMDTEVNVIIPEEHRVKPKAPARTLILLHGLKQNASAWVRMSNAEIYAHHSGFNIIIPEVLYTVIISIVLFRLQAAFNERVEKWTKRRRHKVVR